MTAARRWVVPAYLVLCVALGGASGGGYVANAILQLLAIALIAVACLAKPELPLERAQRSLLILLACVVLLILIQVIPLPTDTWRALPGREAILASLETAGIVIGGHGFVSLVPHESVKSAMWLLPPIAVLSAMIRAPQLYSGRNLAIALVGSMSVAVFLGAMQKAAGPASQLYFYHFTNAGFAVGFFANVNHMASLLLVSIPFQAALLRDALERKNSDRVVRLAAVAASFGVTVAGIVVVGSLAGYGLLLPVTLASALIVRGTRRARTIAALLLPLAVLGAMAAILLDHDGQALLDQASAMSAGSRQTIFATTWIAIRDFWPVGSGLGTFAEAYPSFEDPFNVMRSYVNHAHNDYLELVLETGLAGAVLLGAFLLLWARQAWRIWRDNLASVYAQAGVLASAALLVHSLVDYPLRTAALAGVFAVSLTLMAAPPIRGHTQRRAEGSSRA